jgi:hypothetical protein
MELKAVLQLIITIKKQDLHFLQKKNPRALRGWVRFIKNVLLIEYEN